jgi:glycosyltransferase involved in cell wall biosynthesis
MTAPTRVLVVARPFDLSDARFDGFVTRHRAMVRALASRFDVKVLTLRPGHDDAAVAPELAALLAGDVPLPDPDLSRLGRLRQAVPWARDPVTRRTEDAVAVAAASVRPDVVVTVGPWLEAEYRPLFSRYPTLHLFEEDLTVMEEIAPQSRQARLLRQTLTFIEGHSSPSPRVAVHISPVERDATRRHFPRATPLYLPFTLPCEEWPVEAGCSQGESLLAVGNFSQARNADGLAAVLDEMARRLQDPPRVTIASDAGLHECLAPAMVLPWVDHPVAAGDLLARYRRAWAALVPALRMSGQKTTILQAWTMGCPVVCTEAAARTVDGHGAVLAGGDAAGVVDQIIELQRRPERRGALAEAGRERIRTVFDPRHNDDRLLDAVAGLAGAAPVVTRGR